jgi:hypothetical protein
MPVGTFCQGGSIFGFRPPDSIADGFRHEAHRNGLNRPARLYAQDVRWDMAKALDGNTRKSCCDFAPDLCNGKALLF